jgi:hypothetical protein
MKKSLKCLIAATASVVSTGAFATTNIENPLYMPKSNETYVRVASAIMGKSVEGTQATSRKHRDSEVEFPVWRFFGDLGYGITDRLDVHGHFGYTKDGEIDRKGMHRGRVGLMYRVLTEEQSSFVLDLYGDAYLSGVSPMKGTYRPNGFDFSNYSNGRWGAIFGTRFGKTWDKFTLAAHIEYLQTFGNHNNKIQIDPNVKPLANKLPDIAVINPYLEPYKNMSMRDFGFPGEISVDLRSTHETTAGFDMMYQASQKWSFGGGFEYIEHYNNGVKGIHTQLKNKSVTLPAALPAPLGGKTISTDDIVTALLAETNNMKDGWDEYVFKINTAYQMTDSVQLATFLEYTFDDAQPMSQNATDFKMEWGLRLNARF